MNLPTPLRAITLHPWWAFAITHGDKRVEYRTRPLPAKFVGVPVALHAGSPDSPGISDAKSLGAPVSFWRAAGCPSSAFVAVVVFDRAVSSDDLPMRWRCAEFVGWRIAEVHCLSVPVPAAGKQGWWKCTDEQREAIARGMEVKP